MRMDSKQNRQYYHSVHGDEDNNDLIDRRKCCAKPLGIQRCNSDGVLVQQNGCQKGRPTSKSSSEVSINGICEELVTQADTDACAFATNTCIGNGSIDRKRVNGIKKDILCRQQSSRESNIMANGSSTQSVEQRKPYSMINNEARVNNIDESVLIGRVNGMNLNVDATSGRPDYLSNVCNTYRQEADILYGRTRGGINQNMVGIESNLQNGHENGDSNCSEMLVCHENHRSSANDIGQSDRSNKRTAEDGSNLRIPNVHQNYLVVSAPLAVPENLSDEESASSFGNSENNTILRALELGQVEDELYEDNEMELMDTDVEGGVDRIMENGLNVSSHPVDVSNGANDDSDEISIENNKELPDSEHVSETEVTLQNEGNKTGSDNQEVENVQQVEEQTRSSSSSSLDSIDDIGDFIEADLPPNNDRLAFFARESSSSSTTDEDEGCGDEVLPNANEDEESENETIDPLTHAEQHNISGELITEKLLNNTSSELLSYSNDFTRSPYAFMNSRVEGTCNIFCNRSLEDNEVVGEDSDLPDLPHANLEASGYSVSNIDNITLPYSYAADNRNESLPKCENSCVSCDKPVDKSLQRKDEIGVVVCDKCFNERDFDKIRKSENVVRKKIRTVPHSSSTNRLSYRNSYCRTNSQDKVSNASHSSIGLSSSDSDPFERLYVSDSSEMVSPDVDTGVESVFPSSSTSSDGASVQYNQINCVSSSSDERRLPGSVGIHRQSVSLEYETPDEVLYCPYYTRRSRSLDQDLTLNGAANLSPDRDIPNISVTSSNFQDDESNNQEKVFDKRPYHVEPPIPTYSSSDEEENTRVPAPYLNHTDMQEENGAGTPSDMNSLIYMHHMSNPEFETTPQNIIVADEPIYEDIEDLQLLLEDRENVGDLDNRSTTQPLCHAISKDRENDRDIENRSTLQPLCHAISKLRRKKRSRSPVSDVEKVMIWNEYEAYVVQVKQIGTSACGPTAVLNVLKAFDFQVEKEEVTQKITSTMRMEAAPIPYYLFSRYSAGTTAQALVDGVCSVTRGAIRGRFFHFYPKRDVELLKWLGHWMKKGAVPVATLNLQRGVKPGWTIPDAWHHQMVYGVSSKGVYLTNPLEIVPESVILEQLTSDSILLVRKQDVVSRFRDWCPLNEILKQRDPRWMTMNVLGQIVHMLREQCMPQDQQSATRSLLTSHIRIPATYKAGIILYMRSNSEHFNELMQTPELPLKKPSESES